MRKTSRLHYQHLWIFNIDYPKNTDILKKLIIKKGDNPMIIFQDEDAPIEGGEETSDDEGIEM